MKKHLKKTGPLILLTFVWGAVNLLILMPIKNQWFSAGEFIDALWTWKQGWINHFWFMGAVGLHIFVVSAHEDGVRP